jgi:hypothetical protein
VERPILGLPAVKQQERVDKQRKIRQQRYVKGAVFPQLRFGDPEKIRKVDVQFIGSA